MGFMSPPRTPVMPTPPPPPPPVDEARAAVLAEESMSEQMKKRKGRGSTIVAGALGDQKTPTTGTPTLLG